MSDRSDWEDQRPPQKPRKQDNSGWYSWPLIILFFALGLWPLALVLLFLRLFGDDQQKKGNPSPEEQFAQAVREKTAQFGKAEPGPELKKSPKAPKKAKTPGRLLRILGGVCLAIGGCVTLGFLSDLVGGWYVDYEDLIPALSFLISGGVMLGRGQYLAQISRRSQRYILAIGTAQAMSVEEIAKRVNRTEEQATRELQKLIDKGYLGEDAYIDHQRGYFLRFGAEAPKEDTAPREADEGYSGILRNIRRANDRIADPELSRKIDRIEQVSGLIFREVEEHPEKRARIRTFFDYYLPTTQKLLDAYAEFEETGVDGENLHQAKEKIEQTMDAIVEGFEHQLDQLYSADAMDVVSDIKVMEAMLNRDTASVEKDFGKKQQEQ
jgi:DNA-binding Lrp family transcriptional regulator